MEPAFCAGWNLIYFLRFSKRFLFTGRYESRWWCSSCWCRKFFRFPHLAMGRKCWKKTILQCSRAGSQQKIKILRCFCCCYTILFWLLVYRFDKVISFLWNVLNVARFCLLALLKPYFIWLPYFNWYLISSENLYRTLLALVGILTILLRVTSLPLKRPEIHSTSLVSLYRHYAAYCDYSASLN